jgi:hypothetical protein
VLGGIQVKRTALLLLLLTACGGVQKVEDGASIPEEMGPESSPAGVVDGRGWPIAYAAPPPPPGPKPAPAASTPFTEMIAAALGKQRQAEQRALALEMRLQAMEGAQKAAAAPEQPSPAPPAGSMGITLYGPDGKPSARVDCTPTGCPEEAFWKSPLVIVLMAAASGAAGLVTAWTKKLKTKVV